MNRDVLRDAIHAGIIIGVKWAVALTLIAIVLGFILTDYVSVRTNANWAAQQIRQAIAQQTQVAAPVK
jgi:UPF0716 family protein affecting phage T7 exclusion